MLGIIAKFRTKAGGKVISLDSYYIQPNKLQSSRVMDMAWQSADQGSIAGRFDDCSYYCFYSISQDWHLLFHLMADVVVKA